MEERRSMCRKHVNRFLCVTIISQCECSGDPHCLSFELWNIGTCNYLAARDNCKNGYPNGAPTYEVITNPDTEVLQLQLSLMSEQFWLNSTNTTWKSTIILMVMYSWMVSRFLVVQCCMLMVLLMVVDVGGPYIKGAIQVYYSNNGSFRVKILASARNKVCGFCGNFNRNPDDDDMVVGDSPYCMSKYPDAVRGSVLSIPSGWPLMKISLEHRGPMDEDDVACVRDCPNPLPQPGCTVEK